MKKGLFIITTVLVIVACGNEKTDKQSVSVKDSAELVINQHDSIINNYLSSFNEIEHSLNSISERQKAIYTKTEKPSEPKTVVVNEINSEIVAINSLMEKNRKIITELNDKLKSAGTKNEQLEKVIEELNGKLSQKQKDLSALNTKLNKFSAQIVVLYTDIYILNAENANQADIINEQAKELHAAYYIVGTSEYLEKEKIIDKKGGVLGIEKTPELNNDFNAKKFKQIDYTETLSIPINGKDVQIVTSHPTTSYKLEKENGIVKSLTIKNAEEFWKISKYLIIIKGA